MNDSMKTSKAGLKFIAQWEGCVLKPYRDIAGLRTIGIGHLIKPGENFLDTIEITIEKAYELLASDVEICERAIKAHINVELNQDQFDALVSFGFNCGTGVYKTSKACKVLNAGKYEEVPKNLLQWSKARINDVLRVNKGLYNRRKSEGELFATRHVAIIVWSSASLKEAQNYLKKLNLYTLKIDGIWGPGTAGALTKFANSNNLVLGSNFKKEIPLAVFENLKLLSENIKST